MAEAYKCDGCGRFEEGFPLLVLEESGFQSVRYDKRSGPWQVCSWACLGSLAEYKRALGYK